MSLRQKALKGTKWVVIQNLVLHFVSFIVLLFLARLLDPSAFGVMALAATAIAFMQIFIAGGFASAIVQRQEIEKEHLDTAFWTNLAVALIMISILWLSAESIAKMFEAPILEPILLWLSLLLLFRSLNQVQIAILKRNLKFKSLAIREIIADPIAGVVAVVMALSGFGVWSLVARELITSGLRLIILWLATEWRPGLNFSKRHFNDLFSFGVSMLGSNFVGFFSRRSPDLLIGYFLGTAALGYYSVANRVFRMLSNAIGGTLGTVAWPVFSRLQGDASRLKNAFLVSMSTTSLVVLPVFVGLAVMSPELVPIVFGEQWIPSIPVMQVISLLGILLILFTINESVIVALGKPHWRLFIQTGIAITSVTGFFFVVNNGIVWVASWYVIASYLFLPVSLWMVNRLIGISPVEYLRAQLGPVLGSLGIITSILVLRDPLSQFMGMESLAVLLIACGGLIYIAVVMLVSPKAIPEFARLVLSILQIKRSKT